jgi:hypothetical protein
LAVKEAATATAKEQRDDRSLDRRDREIGRIAAEGGRRGYGYQHSCAGPSSEKNKCEESEIAPEVDILPEEDRQGKQIRSEAQGRQEYSRNYGEAVSLSDFGSHPSLIAIKSAQGK